MRLTLAAWFVAAAALPEAGWAAAVGPVRVAVFRAGAGGYHTYRIPALLVTPKGTLLAFCEGRKRGAGDSGDIDLLLRRSFDGGRTWQPQQTVWDDGPNTCGNPCPVLDRRTGTVWLLMTHNLGQDTEAQIAAGTSRGTRTVWVSKSTDDGATWSRPTEITQDVRRPGWTWYATGPGVGIQLRTGRLLVPCDHMVAGSKAQFSHVLYSDDGGKSWHVGGEVGPGCDECQAAELADGTVLLNIRSYRGHHRRLVARSRDGGLHWSGPAEDPALVEPVCQASLTRYLGAKGPLLFANPAGTRRERLTVRLSRDGGRTWPAARVLHEGPAAYSCLAVLADGAVGCLYESGYRSPYEALTFARFPLAWLTGGAEAPPSRAPEGTGR